MMLEVVIHIVSPTCLRSVIPVVLLEQKVQIL